MNNLSKWLQVALVRGDEDFRLDAQEIQGFLDEIVELAVYDVRSMGNWLYDGIYITDGQGKTLYVNKAYERMTGIRLEEIKGRSISELEGKYFKNAVSMEVIRTKKVVNSIGKSLVNMRPMLISGSPIFDEAGEVKLVVVNNRDIGDLLEMKAALEQNKAQLEVAREEKHLADREIEYLRSQAMERNFIAESPVMQQVLEQVEAVSQADVNVLITGETGVGKEVVADAIYENSPLRGKPFIKVNCAAIPRELFESEIFGYEKGAFTGAGDRGKPGVFELANGGTLLMDELGEIPLEMQPKLLRAIQDGRIKRVGGTAPVPVKVRIIAATNRDLKQLMEQGKFREDLYYRLNVFPIHIPPLRERPEDIVPLAVHFIETFRKKHGKHITVRPEVFDLLKSYHWPGNSRELENLIERLTIIIADGGTLEPGQIETILQLGEQRFVSMSGGLQAKIDKYERFLLEDSMRRHGTTRQMARALQISQSAVVKKMRKHGLRVDSD